MTGYACQIMLASAAADRCPFLCTLSRVQVGLSDTYEHLRKLLPDPEAVWITCRGTSMNGDSPPVSFSLSSGGRLRGSLSPHVTVLEHGR